MDNRVKFYSWLIGLLDRKHLTFEEIANEWRDANANQDEDELDKRTFHRYRENIQSQFGITVECDKSDGYRYYLKRDPIANDDVKQRSASEGKANSSAEVDVRKLVRCLPFDRISFLKLICEKHPLPAKMKKFLTPENYYEDCFGIYRMENVPVEKIRIRAFYPEYNYIEEVPLHESQQKVKESKDGMYREYTLTVRPSRDFLQELLWHGRNIIVLKPENLRQEMIGILKDMTKSYETGECLNGEE